MPRIAEVCLIASSAPNHTDGPSPDAVARPLPQSADPTGDLLVCQKCGYDLRGLPGDPIRCPECFRENWREELTGPAATERRLRELQGAGDAFVLATISNVAGIALWWFDGLLPLAAPVLAVGGLLSYYATATARRLGHGREHWAAAWTRYLLLTCALPAVPSALWLTIATIIWTVRSFYRKTTGMDFVDFAAALPILIVVLFLFAPLRRMRRRQRAAFAELIRLATGQSAGDSDAPSSN